ncbi:MAG: SDR family NAD(P)-dependent oxidoreductase [Rhodospirillales bacterium]|nr:SDR family NAD(P)-dependent oxidoreductase [Rhodospirillales bacterium]
MYNLVGKTVLLTGGATGIGRRIATRLAEEGCDIGLLDINEAQARETAELVTKAGGRAAVFVGDVGDYGQVAATVQRFRDTHGHIDILINNAGVIHVSTVADTALEDWRALFRVNLDGVFHCCKAVVPHMVDRGRGRIINTASWFGKIGKPHYGAYCASKFAVIGLTQSLAMELAPHRINVNAVCPGTIVETALREQADAQSRRQGIPTARERQSHIPLGRLGLPDDIARVVAFLASDEADYMTGQAINVTGGLWMS